MTKAEDIVDLQLEAYNQKDYSSFISFYDKDILSYDLSSSLLNPLMSGKHFFDHYKDKFINHPNIKCTVVKRIVHDNFIFDEEIISGYHNRTHKECVIYQVNHQLIVKMWFTPVLNI